MNPKEGKESVQNKDRNDSSKTKKTLLKIIFYVVFYVMSLGLHVKR